MPYPLSLCSRKKNVENDLRAKADRWEMRIWFMSIMALVVALLGAVMAKL